HQARRLRRRGRAPAARHDRRERGPAALHSLDRAMAKRDFLAIADFTRDEIRSLFDLAERMKQGAYREEPLAGKTLAMIFAKSSTRTRVSFEVGAYQLDGNALFLSSWDIQLGRGEPIAATARELRRDVVRIMSSTSLPNGAL